LKSVPPTSSGFLKVSRFQSIKTKILLFALLATIIPSLVLGILFYMQNSRLLREKITQELRNATVQASGKLDLWLNERLYDMRVFSSSYILSENLVRLLEKPRTSKAAIVAREHLGGYLQSVTSKITIYQELSLIGWDGEVIVSSSGDPFKALIPAHWSAVLKQGTEIGAKPHFEPHLSRTALFLAETVRASDGSPLGVLSAIISLDAIVSLLDAQAVGGIDEIYLTDAGGRVLVSSQKVAEPYMASASVSDIIAASRDNQMGLIDYICYRGKAVVGIAAPIPAMGWVMITEIEREKAYAEIALLGRLTRMLVGGLMLCIGLSAYLFGHSLVRPLQRLSRGATRVASGNLEVDLPVTGLSEVSYLTQVFNHMVASLRCGQEELSAANQALVQTNQELQQLSITDGLTGLNNRNHIMALFQQELARAKRSNQPLAVLMLDIDHFKQINDTHGHQIGDAVLQGLAQALLRSVRDCDHVGRYGGEEFIIILPDSDKSNGAGTAERIRQNASEVDIDTASDPLALTISIGVAAYPENGQDVETVLRQADDALYLSKADGRNRVALAKSLDLPAAQQNSSRPKLKLIG
jgi:diguanylate cyclase (GGDEF)-like protein